MNATQKKALAFEQVLFYFTKATDVEPAEKDLMKLVATEVVITMH